MSSDKAPPTCNMPHGVDCHATVVQQNSLLRHTFTTPASHEIFRDGGDKTLSINFLQML